MNPDQSRRARAAARCFSALRRVVVPRWLDERAGDELQRTFEERLAEIGSPSAWWYELAREICGLVFAGVTARFTRRRPRIAGPLGRAGQAMRFDSVASDLRFALRSMRRNRVVTALAVLTLAAGVGASTAMYSVVDAVLLRPLPFDHPEQIVMVNPTVVNWRDTPSLRDAWQYGRFSTVEARAWLDRQRSFQAAGAYAISSARVALGRGSERVATAETTPGVWVALGVRPMLGRLPGPNETDSVAVVTYAYWRSHLGGDSAAIGRTIRLDDYPTRVIGVLPKDFDIVGIDADIWLPLSLAGDALDNHDLLAMGRLREGVTIARAGDELTRILHGVDAVDPKHDRHTAHIVSPVREATDAVRTPLFVLSIAAAVLLIAACASVALLLLGVGADRARELAVRQALGARRRRIVVQLLIESMALGAVGAAAGVLVALLGIKLLIAKTPPGIPRIDHAGIDLHSFAITALLALATGVLVGLVPAMSLSRVDAGETLRAGATAASTGKLQRGIVAAELALATVLLVAAGLLTRTMAELQRVNLGFNPAGVFAVRVVLPYDKFYGAGKSPDSGTRALEAYVTRITDAMRSAPGVSDVATTSDMPFSNDRATNPVQPEGYTPAPGEIVDVARRWVTPNYFSMLRIPPLEGRVLAAGDDRPNAEPVMVVTDQFARHFWPNGRWVGRLVGFRKVEYRVVGVIADTREHDLRGDEDKYKFYVPAVADGDIEGNFLLRTSTLAALTPIIRERLWHVDPEIIVASAEPLRDRVERSVADDRFRMTLMSVFSSVAALFSLLGIYGVMSRSVARRRREMALRTALGAQSGRLVAMVLMEAGQIGIAGALAGIALSILGSRLLERLIWGVPRLDPLTYGAAAGLLFIATILAALAPARDAATSDLMGVLRT
jgi:predicted permease